MEGVGCVEDESDESGVDAGAEDVGGGGGAVVFGFLIALLRSRWIGSCGLGWCWLLACGIENVYL